MREILFRGKRKDNGEWVHGYYIQIGDAGKLHYILTGKLAIKNGVVGFEQYEVIPETIGQYTGMEANGKKIFDGDICSKFSNYSGKKLFFPIVFEQGLFYAKYSETAGMPLCDICEKVEIVGNIHDNPELLKGGAD